MYRDKSIGVVIPAYNEEKLIVRVIETLPDYVDQIIVIDDASTDDTVKIVKSCQKHAPNDKIILIMHDVNQGVGGAISDGYKWCRDHKIDIVVVMAGDAQMDPKDLPSLLDPIVEDKTDYAKGNRLFYGNAWNIIPKVRYLGNAALSLLTKIASGYWHVADSQCGYTATSLKVLETIDLDTIYRRYGMPNDLLVKLNIYNFRVKDIPVTPIYNIGEISGIKIERIIFTLFFLLVKLFIWRMKEKYVIRDFHPLIFFYFLAFLLLSISIPLTVKLFAFWIQYGHIPRINSLALMFSLIMGFQSLFFAMLFDMENNKELK